MTARALVTGGARSGKSGFAENFAYKIGGDNVLYVATAEAPERDGELLRRVEKHRSSRPSGWSTFEISYAPGGPGLAEVPEAATDAAAVLLDCLTLWVSGRMSSGAGDEEIIRELEELLGAGILAPLVVVTDEVGLGLVPESAEGRRFRDLLGLANQKTAAFADEVHLCVAGVPLRIK